MTIKEMTVRQLLSKSSELRELYLQTGRVKFREEAEAIEEELIRRFELT